MSTKPRIFMTHAPEDEKWAVAIAAGLEEAGMEVWRPREALEPGASWQRELRKALKRASTILVLVSANSASSRSMQFEAGAALGVSFESDKRVVPVYLSSRGPDYLPLLRGLEGISLAGLRPEEAGKRVADHLIAAA